MDEDVARWILEFLIRQQQMDDRSLKSVLSVLPVSDTDYRLKKTVLLKSIESEISDGSVSEKVLELIETIAALDEKEGFAIPESIKAAYCAAAVDCTVRFLGESGNEQGRYFEAVKRIWRGRIESLERSEKAGLGSDQLRNWKDEIEAAIWDRNLCEKILMRNTRNEAVKAVRVYVTEAWKIMGPAFLELAAKIMSKPEALSDNRTSCENWDLGVAEKAAMGDKGQVLESAVSLPNESGDLGVSNRLARRDKDDRVEEATTPPRDLGKTVVEETTGALPDAGQDMGAPSKTAIRDKDQVEQQAVASPNASLKRGVAEKNAKDQVEERAATLPDASARNDEETQKGRLLPKCMHPAGHGRRSRGGAKIVDTEDSSIEVSHNQYDCLPSAEVNKVQEALRSSSLELQAVLKDPLPDALHLAETVMSDMARKNANQVPLIENQDKMDTSLPNPENKSHELLEENLNRMDVEAPNPSVNQGVEAAQANEGNPGSQNGSNQNVAPRPSLMERNSTARTYEWDDAIDTLPEGSPSRSNRLHLPSPKRKAVSPLKKYETTKFVRRRSNKRWSVLEEDTLRTGVQKFGRGNWKLILNSYRDIFEERTEVDLKDKWRNMTR